jgi:RAP1 GTPase activating protein 1
LATDSPKGPLVVSVLCDGGVYKAVLRSIQGSERLTVQASSIPREWWRKLFGLSPSIKNVFEALSNNIPAKSLKLCKELNLPNEILAMEERQVIRSYKFGVGYLTAGQTTEEHMLSNLHGIWFFLFLK